MASATIQSLMESGIKNRMLQGNLGLIQAYMDIGNSQWDKAGDALKIAAKVFEEAKCEEGLVICSTYLSHPQLATGDYLIMGKAPKAFLKDTALAKLSALNPALTQIALQILNKGTFDIQSSCAPLIQDILRTTKQIPVEKVLSKREQSPPKLSLLNSKVFSLLS
ncbi:hypothetical protein FGO68_gene7988 [Halteria grandinella]|uniref:Uncharacterized protein n=1 Tax=Halteria grandinella TaxID=5974 RepID=A0A8J8NH70_HALGN|nr:hypothetical protein FGO68_gene7988 [Halteria grandinella]